MRKKALIFGVDGQDGSLMSDFLIKKRYKVTGTFKNRKLKNLKKLNIYKKLKLTKWADRKHRELESQVISKSDKVVTVSWKWASETQPWWVLA